MTAQPIDADGNIVAAIRRLKDAVSALTDSRSEMSGAPDCPDCRQDRCPGHMQWIDSWYLQLRDSTGGAQGIGHHAAPRSLPPAWTDAVQILIEIDERVLMWQKDPGPFDGDLTPENPPTPETVRRLHLLEKRGWRPQDTRQLEDCCGTIESWVSEIKALFTAEPVRALWAAQGGGFAACPACDKTMAKKRDNAGDIVGTPALQLSNDGTTRCQACKTSWGPERAMWVCRMLGYPLPTGVLE